jgi:hypothetical protein
VTVSSDELARAVVNPRLVLRPKIEQKPSEAPPGSREAEASRFMQGGKLRADNYWRIS